MPTFITPVNITGTGGIGSWIDVDLSSYVPEGTTGVILRVNCIQTGTILRLRKNGSTDSITIFEADDLCQYNHMVGVDSSRILERYINGTIASYWEIYLVGYFGSEAVFFDNMVSKGSIGGNSTWHDVNISSDTGTDTATAALVWCWVYDGGVRINGSSTALINGGNSYISAVVGVDGSEIFEFRSGIARTLYLVGYITSGFTAVDPPTNVSFDSPLDTYTALGVTASKAGYAITADGAGSVGLRRSADSSFDLVRNTHGELCYFCVGSSPEAEISATTMDLYETGYFAAGSPTALPRRALDGPLYGSLRGSVR